MRPAIGGERRGGLDRSGHRRSCTCRGSPRRQLENRECRGRQRVDWLTHTFGNAAPRAGGENWREKGAGYVEVRGSLWSMTSRRAITCCSSTEAREPTNKARRRARSGSFSRNPTVAPWWPEWPRKWDPSAVPNKPSTTL